MLVTAQAICSCKGNRATWAKGVGIPHSLTLTWGPFDGKLQLWLLCAWCPHLLAMNMQIAIHCLPHRLAQQKRSEVVLEVSVTGAKTGMGALEKKKNGDNIEFEKAVSISGDPQVHFSPASCLMSMLRSYQVICG